jgi:hypothetical protein
MLPSALCPLTHPSALDNLYIYIDGSWAMAEQYWMKNEMLDVLRMKLWAWGTYWGNDGNTLRRKKNWKIPLSPTPKPKRHKNLPSRLHAEPSHWLAWKFYSQNCWLPFTAWTSTRSKSGVCVSTALATSTLIISFSENFNFQKLYISKRIFFKEIEESSEIFFFLKWKFQN